MSAPTVDSDLVARICRDAVTHGGVGSVVDAVRDPLDDTMWVRLSCLAGARAALAALTAYGLGARDLDGRRAARHRMGRSVAALASSARCCPVSMI